MRCECQRCCARERGGQTTEQRGGGREGGERARTTVVTMRSRVRYGIVGGSSGGSSGGTREMNIRFFGYFAERRYLASCSPRIERSKYALPFPRSSSRCVSTAPLDPCVGPRRISHITFRDLHLLHLHLLFSCSSSCSFSLRSAVPNAPTLAREIARLSYLASLLGENLSRGILAASRRGCRSRLKGSRSIPSRYECRLISFDIMFHRDVYEMVR